MKVVASGKLLQVESESTGVLQLLKICLVLLKRKVFSWNGVFYGSIGMFVYYFLVRKNLLLQVLWYLNRKLEKREARNMLSSVVN